MLVSLQRDHKIPSMASHIMNVNLLLLVLHLILPKILPIVPPVMEHLIIMIFFEFWEKAVFQRFQFFLMGLKVLDFANTKQEKWRYSSIDSCKKTTYNSKSEPIFEAKTYFFGSFTGNNRNTGKSIHYSRFFLK
jgi:hypothetical protein